MNISLIQSRICILLIVFALTPQLWAQQEAPEERPLDTWEQAGLMSWTVGLSIGLGKTTVSHNETSSVAGFTALGSDISVDTYQFQLFFMKEFLSMSRISFTVLAEGGILDGKEEGTQGSNPFEEKVKGVTYGAGGTVNYNFSKWGYKLQPFAGAKYVIEDVTADVTYEISGSATRISHELQNTAIEGMAGIRVFDPFTQMMSVFAIKYLTGASPTTTSSIDGAAGTVTNNADFVERDPLIFNIAFGGFF